MSSSASHFLLLFVIGTLVTTNGGEPSYSSYWVVRLDEPIDARKIAEENQFEYIGQIPGDELFHRFRLQDEFTRQRRAASHHTKRLMNHPRIQYATQEIILNRMKRDFMEFEDPSYLLPRPEQDESLQNVEDIEMKRKKKIKDMNNLFNDPYWNKQWYLHDVRTDLSEPKVDLHVYPVWKRGISGKGVVVTVIDDGLLSTHPDLRNNYLDKASFDFNGNHGSNPKPRETRKNLNKHGTRCAGEIAMVANNSICGVGIAYNAKIGGIRMLDGVVTDSVEASSLSYGIGVIDIYSASWGPTDNGETMEGPGILALRALERGIQKGRNGLGSIYMWASGNGGVYHDDCACDGYASSIYTIAVNSVTSDQKAPSYIELCPSTMATTYSGSFKKSNRVVGTDLHNECTDQHGGTSASAPLAAGIMALVLEANPTITWRDAQHLIAWTSEVHPLIKNPGWRRNAAGFLVNARFGFGLMNADAIVKMADRRTWKTVPAKSQCRQNKIISVERSSEESGRESINKTTSIELASGQTISASIQSDGCQGEENEINFLEHIQVNVTMSYSRRGSLSISLTSPGGMKTQMLRRRSRDETNGIWRWPFTSVHNWGESPRGVWRLEVEDQSGMPGNKGFLEEFEIVFHGTKEMPDHVRRAKGHRRPYNMEYNSVKNVRSKKKKKISRLDDELNIRTLEAAAGYPGPPREGLQRHRPYPEDLARFLQEPPEFAEDGR